MHDRNIYKIRPNFTELAKQFDYFAPFLTLDQKGTPKINFKDPSALRALSRALLEKDFGLNVNIPDNVLIPTIPLRLNYILWVEDLLGAVFQNQHKDNNNGPVRGIDVGTGATAIYALLSARKNNWHMVGTEVDKNYVRIAMGNVARNKLSNLVTILPSNPEDGLLTPILSQVEDYHFSFTMCNPPFFASDEETDSVKKGRFSSTNEPLRLPPSATKTGQSTELIAEGGELEFVQKLIQESIKHPRKVLLYTTMLGIKAHLKLLINYLRSHNITRYTTTEFVQGKTMRWGLAWSLCENVNILPPEPDLTTTFPNFPTLVNFESLMLSYLKDLNLDTLRWLSTTGTNDSLEIVAKQNTWSHQRQKRRIEKRLESSGMPAEKIQKIAKEANKDVYVALLSSASASSTMNRTIIQFQLPQPTLLNCFLNFFRDEDGTATICFRFREGILGKQGLHQIAQYLKNRLEKDKKDPSSPVSSASE